MSVLDEITSQPSSPMNAALREGVREVSASQEVTFTKYNRVVMPFDGTVFWVRASLQGDATPPVTVQGSLHVAFDKQQDETENYSRVAVIFTSTQDVAQNFDVLNDGDILIATADQASLGEMVGNTGSETPFPVRMAFSRLGFYQNAGIFHYSGTALYPHMASQVVDDLARLDQTPVVSNSLPFFLALNGYQDFYGFGNQIPLFASMLVPANRTPPYGAVHVMPTSTEALASAPYLDQTYAHYALARDRVVVTLYGVHADAAQTFLDCVLQRSRDYNEFGIANCPVVRDEKSGQNDLSLLAVKKTVEFDVTYLQTAARNIARQLITSAACAANPVYPARWPVNPAAPTVMTGA